MGNIFAINSQAQTYVAKFQPAAQAAFASYNLVGTVWMLPNSYSLTSDQTSAVGSVDLANATAETFVQNAKNTPISGVLNCFLCHNAGSYSFQNPPPAKLPNRLIAISHVLAIGSPYEMPELDFRQAAVGAAGTAALRQVTRLSTWHCRVLTRQSTASKDFYEERFMDARVKPAFMTLYISTELHRVRDT